MVWFTAIFHTDMFWISIVYVFLCGRVFGQTCRQMFTHRPLLGVRCVTDTEIYSRTSTRPHTCVNQCIRKDNCTVANYNMLSNTCFLSNDKCIRLRVDTEFYVSTIRSMKHREQCFRWVPIGQFDEASTFESPECYMLTVLLKPCHLGRLVYANNILPGKYEPLSDEVHSVLNGDKIEEGNKEIMDIDPGCPVLWVPFTAGSDIPDVAVKGGYLADSSTDLYVMRAVYENDLLMFGYYDPMAAVGYLTYFGANEVTQMDLLVFVWYVFSLHAAENKFTLCKVSCVGATWIVLFSIQSLTKFFMAIASVPICIYRFTTVSVMCEIAKSFTVMREAIGSYSGARK